MSPNGRHIAFTTGRADGALWVQDLDQEEPRRLPGTDGANGLFWSPDSEYIGYGAGRELRKIAVRGGASGLVCALPAVVFEGTWSPDGGSIVSAASGGSVLRQSLFIVSAQGGSAEEFLTPSDVGSGGVFASRRPSFLPAADARVLLFNGIGDAGNNLYAKNLDTGRTVDLGPGNRPVYSAATGHLIYESENPSDLWARPFSPGTLAFTGPAFPLRQNARQASLADDGTLVYLDGVSRNNDQTLVWRDRSGAILESVGQRQPDISHPSLSPDGRRVAVASSEDGERLDIWVHDLARSTKTRLTFDPGTERSPTWSPSGDQIIYAQEGANGSSLMRKAADGTGDAVALVETVDRDAVPNIAWSRDGRYLVYQQGNMSGGGDLRYVEIGADGRAGDPVPLVASPANEGAPKFSPDGRFVAYVSDESGRTDVYVRPFPGGPGRWQASVEGGSQPRWSPDGTELFFVRDDTLFSVSVSTEQGVRLGRPQEMFRLGELRSTVPTPKYDISADGQRFLAVEPVEQQQSETAPPKIRVVQNWYEEFRGRKRD